MNEHAMLHVMDSQWSFPISPNEIVIRFRTSREDKDIKVYLVYGPKFTYHLDRFEKEMKVKYKDRLFNYYEIKLCLKDTRLAYIFKIVEDGKEYFFSEDGLSENYNYDEGFYNYFQMPYINEIDIMPVVDWTQEAVFYQIFIDRFAAGDEEKDKSYINLKWNEIPNPKSFTGGDLKGILDKLDYLEELGINALYLTPIFRSPTNHKYDTIDYYEIDPQFGDKETFKILVDSLHKKGMKIILDAVFNHTSIKNPIFQDVIEKGRDSKYHDWFYVDGNFPDRKNLNFENFSVVDYMPKFNTSNPKVQDYLIDIGKYWIEEFDIDGWRLDVSDEVSHDFWRKFRKEIKAIKKDAFIFGENWHNASVYLQGDQFDSIMNYTFTKASLDYFKQKIKAKEMADKLNHILTRYKDQVNRMNLNLLDSHDTDRIFTELGKDYDLTLAAFALLMAYQGIPCIYYGSEIFLEGGYDPDNRRTFDWENKDNQDYKDLFRKIIKLRSYEEFQKGDIDIKNDKELLCVSRTYKDKNMKLFINLGSDRNLDLIDSEEILSNRYDKGCLKEKGFLVIKERSGKNVK